MKSNYSKISALFALLILLSGCGTLSNGRGWGQDVSLFSGLDRVGTAAIKTLRDPAVWIPAAGAMVFSLGNLDEKVSDWGSEHTPAFGDQGAADVWSSDLRNAATVAFVLTGLATPSGDNSTEWSHSKVKGFSVESAAMLAATSTTKTLKSAVSKTRPNREDDHSFPSGHATVSFVSASLAARNIDSLHLTQTQKTLSKVGVYTLAAGSAWGRVEAEMHYPSDVLAAAALGNFFALIIHDAFMGLDEKENISFLVTPSDESVFLGIEMSF